MERERRDHQRSDVAIQTSHRRHVEVAEQVSDRERLDVPVPCRRLQQPTGPRERRVAEDEDVLVERPQLQRPAHPPQHGPVAGLDDDPSGGLVDRALHVAEDLAQVDGTDLLVARLEARVGRARSSVIAWSTRLPERAPRVAPTGGCGRKPSARVANGESRALLRSTSRSVRRAAPYACLMQSIRLLPQHVATLPQEGPSLLAVDG